MRHMNREQRRRYMGKWYISVPLMCLIFTIFFAAGYGLSQIAFRLTGAPSAFYSHIIAGLLGFLLFTAATRLMMAYYGRRIRKSRFDKMRGGIMNDTIEALDRIAHGDFSVLIQVDGQQNPFFAEVAESVNKMARELGSMEKLRQDFISDVSHEIQSPLTSISGFAALLKSDTLTGEQRAHYIDVIETEARRLSKLSDNLLRLSSLEGSEEPLHEAVFSLDKQIQHVVLMLEPQWAAKNIELSLDLEKTAYNGDEGLLGQVWINLIHNAIKFTPERGEISVTLTNDTKTAVCRVSDTGAGIAEEDSMHIFERFYKADKARDRALGGSGLGLSLVKKIVGLHGGTVTAQSELNKGSVFTVSLPIKK